MIFGNKLYMHSPIPHQSKIWVAEYYDGTNMLEYDPEQKKNNDFYDIDKSKIIAFGLIGDGDQLFFNVANGVFSINGSSFQIAYKTDDEEYPLTGRTFLYNDLIQYKDASTTANVKYLDHSGSLPSRIEQYNFGYKKQMDLVNANISFQCVCSLPLNQPAYFQIKISSNKDLDGKLIIRRDGMIVDEINAPLLGNMSGNIHWELR
ncbi:hypothetical protein D3C74_51350 [compost metagenome]